MDLRKYLAPDQTFFAALLDQMTDVCFAIDSDGRIRFANRASERLMRRPLDEIAGAHVLDVVHAGDRALVVEILEAMERHPDEVRKQTFRVSIGDTIDILEATWSTVHRTESDLLILMSAHVATERVQAVAKLREREEELGRAERVAQLATWERNLTTNQFSASRQLYEIYGVPRNTEISFMDLARYVPEEDLILVQQTMRKAQEERRAVAIDHRIIRPDGQERIAHLRGAVEVNGEDFIMYGTAQDVTEVRTMERALRASEQRFRAIFDSMFQFIGLMRPDGTLIEANETAVRFAGVTREEVIDRPFWECYWWSIGVAHQERLKEAIREAASGAFVRYKTEVYGAGEQTITIDFSIKPVFDAEGRVELLIPEGRDISEEVAAQRALQDSHRRLRELTAQLHSAQEEERARIAREVHDVLGQAITALRLDIVWLLDRCATDDTAYQKRAESTLKLVEDTIITVRRISHELRPGVLDHFGLPTAIEWLCEQHQERSSITFTSEDLTDSRLEEIDPALAIALFRILQEALTNVHKHAAATSVRTSLAVENNTLRMVITDDGRGIRQEDIERSTSLGLLNMRERILPWNGFIDIHGQPGRGTRITVTIPLP